jgi:hypothetical protein
MKKLVLITTLIATVSGLTAFGQGYVTFADGTRYSVANLFSTPGTKDSLYSSMDVALYIATASGGSVPAPAVDAIAASTPTTGTFSPTGLAWADITGDPNFQLAVNTGNGNASAIQGVITGSHGGGFSYFAGVSQPLNTVAGVTGGASYEMYVVGWNSAYASPAAAALNGSAVGWSAPFLYATGAASGSPVIATAMLPFGIFAVPEPTTLALAGLGAVSLLLFRRRK